MPSEFEKVLAFNVVYGPRMVTQPEGYNIIQSEIRKPLSSVGYNSRDYAAKVFDPVGRAIDSVRETYSSREQKTITNNPPSLYKILDVHGYMNN